MFGAGAMTNAIDEIRESEMMFIIGSNTTEAHPIIAMEMKRARQNGAKLVVADPREIWMAEMADLHLQLKPGTDVWLLSAMAHVIINEGLHDQAFIDAHTENFQAVVDKVQATRPKKPRRSPVCRPKTFAPRLVGTPRLDMLESTTHWASPNTPTGRITFTAWPTWF